MPSQPTSTPSPGASRSVAGMLHSNSTKHSYWLLQGCQTKGYEWDPVNQVGHILANMIVVGIWADTGSKEWL